MHKGKLLLCEEKDLLREEYGLVHCSIDKFQAIPFNSVKYKKENAYGVEAMVLRNAVPSDIHISPISIEELFVFMVKYRWTNALVTPAVFGLIDSAESCFILEHKSYFLMWTTRLVYIIL